MADRSSIAHHTVAAILLTVYGTSVCNFIGSLHPLLWLSTVSGVIAIQAIARAVAYPRFVASTPSGDQPLRAFLLEVALFAAGALLVGAINFLWHGFPPGSAVKSAVGFVGVGIFAATDQAILHLLRRFETGGLQNDKPVVRWPLVYRLAGLAAAILVFSIAVVGLLLLRIIEDGAVADRETKLLIATELTFVALVFAGYLTNLLRNVGRLLNRSLKEQIEALQLAKTSLSARRAVVATEDELGWIAAEINGMLDQLVHKSSEAARANDAMLRGLLSLASTRDNETALHIKRTQAYVRILAQDLMRSEPQLGLTADDVAQLSAAAPLHDIGKVAIPDAILRKPGKLSADEFAIMQSHVTAGVTVIDTVISEVGNMPFLSTARGLIASHHEKFDGTGYPEGLSGDSVPLPARIMAVADVYDALRSKRVYKPALSHEAAAEIIFQSAGSHFDPVVVEAFKRSIAVIEATALVLADPVDVSKAA